MSTQNVNSAAVGAILGAAVGDAAGAVLEFMGSVPTEEDVEWALSMPGGGCWGVAPGQITDDTELAIMQADGLLASRGEPDLDELARGYCAWARSDPFDIGNTTARAFMRGEPSAKACRGRADERPSRANGSLMRMTPMGVWGSGMSPQLAGAAGAADSRLSHSHPSAVGACGAYAAAIAYLVRNHGTGAAARLASSAIDAACGFLASDPEFAEPLLWLNRAVADERVAFQPHDGYAEIAFTNAFRHLARASSFEDAMRQTLLGGGDTDTNAAIVCGLIGALHGDAAIPPEWSTRVLSCDTSEGRPRPAMLSSSRIPTLAVRLAHAHGA